MKGFLHGQSKGKKAMKLHRLGSGSMSITTMCTSTTTTTVPPPVALEAGTEAQLPEVPKELPLLFLEESIHAKRDGLTSPPQKKTSEGYLCVISSQSQSHHVCPGVNLLHGFEVAVPKYF